MQSYINTHSTVEDWRNLEKMKWNEAGRQKLTSFVSHTSVRNEVTSSFFCMEYRRVCGVSLSC